MKWFTFLALAFMFIFSPYQIGLYFNSSIYSLSILLFALYFMVFITLVVKKELSSIGKLSFLLLLPLCYLFPLFTAENPQGAWDSFLQWVTFPVFMLLLYWVGLERKINGWLPLVFQVTGIWISFFSIFVYFGWLDFPKAFIADRLASIVQYPNTFAMLMIVFFLFSLVMLTSDKLDSRFLLLFSLPQVVYIVCFILSFSRGMMLVFPIVWFLGLLLLSGKKQLEYTIYSVASVGLALLSFLFIEKAGAVMVTGSSALFIGIVYFMKTRAKALFEKIKLNRFVLPVLLVVLAGLTVLDLVNEGLGYRTLPVELQERISSINLAEGTAKERLVFASDAFEISSDAPLIGMGGEAFRVIYKKYQSLPYQSNKIHNGYLEWLVDTGWIGLLLFIGVFGYLYVQLFRTYQKEKNVLQIAVFIASLALFFHSSIDFNFSYGTTWFVALWLMVIGVVTPEERIKGKKGKGKTEIVGQNQLPHLVIYSVFSLMVLVSGVYSYKFMKAEQAYQLSKAYQLPTEKEKALERAIGLNPYNVSYRLATNELYASKGDLASLQAGIEAVTSLEPNNSTVALKSAVLLEKIGQENEARTLYGQALKMDKFNRGLYERAIQSYVKGAVFEGSIALANKAVEVYRDNLNYFDYFYNEPLTDYDAFNGREFTVTNSSHLHAAIAFYLLEAYEEVITMNELITKEASEKQDALALVAMAYEKLGELEKANEIKAQPKNELILYLKER
ncbi:O-antigen ligase family protein [Bacillus timonensis]|nr:O-antigen ligase family protein [Bacillus timonensis]